MPAALVFTFPPHFESIMEEASNSPSNTVMPINAPVNLSESILEITFNAADKIKIAVENASIIVPALANCITPFPPRVLPNAAIAAESSTTKTLRAASAPESFSESINANTKSEPASTATAFAIFINTSAFKAA